MGDDGDPQRLKKIAAAAYDYENDARWKEYWGNVLIPPHMASRSDVVDHFKRKFYQRFIDPDLIVEAMPSISSSQSARASTRVSAPPSTENSRPRNTAGRGSNERATEPPSRNSNSVALDQRSIHFAANAWVLAVSVVGILPIVPQNLSSKAYRVSLLGTILSSLYILYTRHGKPSAWNLAALQVWLQSIMGTKDFIHFLFSIMFLTSQLHLKFALVPILCWSLEHVAKFLRRNFTSSSLYRKYLEKPCLWVEANTSTLNTLSSNTEIALGFLLIVSLLSWKRNIIQTFMYWHLMKLMYHAPPTAAYHRVVWSNISRATTPYIYRYVPFLNSPLRAIQRWWLR